MTTQKLSTKFDRVRKHLDAIAAVTVAIGTLGGALLAVSNWIIAEVSAQSNQRIDQLQNDIKEQQQKQEQATTRIELLQLMEHYQDNTVAIEKLAKYYFKSLSGNSWMSEKYSKFAKEHGLDASFVID